MSAAPTNSLRGRLSLARRILDSHYNRPATALWRVFESEVVLERLRGQGRGLDLGCGDGELARVVLGQTGLRWTALDIDANDVEAARRTGFYESVKVAPASEIPEPDETFDVVFSNSSLEHMQDIDSVLDEVARVLRRGGTFAFTVPLRSFDDLLLWRRVLDGVGLSRLSKRYAEAIDERLAHRNLLTEDDWRERLQARGFHIERVCRYLTARTIAVWETLSNATGGLAWLLTGKHPHEVQRRAGLLRGSNRLLGAVASVFLAPAVLLASGGTNGATGALYVEARRG
jgi:SAM-dependent methyltransferase